jgi:hypothetical protein
MCGNVSVQRSLAEVDEVRKPDRRTDPSEIVEV